MAPTAIDASESSDLSGRRSFSVRLPEALYQQLDSLRQREGTSMNRLIASAVASLVQRPELAPTASSSDVDPRIARDAIRQKADRQPSPVGALKGIAKYLSNRGDVALACVLWAAAARLVNEQNGAAEAAAELTHSAAVAEQVGQTELAVALYEEALGLDPNKLEAANRLGQLLHHLAQQHGDDLDRYREAERHLARVTFLDNRAKLFHGWSAFHVARAENDTVRQQQALSELEEALKTWAFQTDSGQERNSWIRQVAGLVKAGLPDRVRALVDFANQHARWGPIDAEELTRSAG